MLWKSRSEFKYHQAAISETCMTIALNIWYNLSLAIYQGFGVSMPKGFAAVLLAKDELSCY